MLEDGGPAHSPAAVGSLPASEAQRSWHTFHPTRTTPSYSAHPSLWDPTFFALRRGSRSSFSAGPWLSSHGQSRVFPALLGTARQLWLHSKRFETHLHWRVAAWDWCNPWESVGSRMLGGFGQFTALVTHQSPWKCNSWCRCVSELDLADAPIWVLERGRLLRCFYNSLILRDLFKAILSTWNCGILQLQRESWDFCSWEPCNEKLHKGKVMTLEQAYLKINK